MKADKIDEAMDTKDTKVMDVDEAVDTKDTKVMDVDEAVDTKDTKVMDVDEAMDLKDAKVMEVDKSTNGNVESMKKNKEVSRPEEEHLTLSSSGNPQMPGSEKDEVLVIDEPSESKLTGKDPLTGDGKEKMKGIEEPSLKNEQPVVAGEEKPRSVNVTDAKLFRYLVSQTAKNCEVVEAAALDFIADDLHHPVISCFREIKKSDFDVIFNQAKFKTEINELEQGITCITLLDYIATSLGNPLYSEFLTKNEYSIRPKVTKVFTELRRVLKDWAENDPATFGSGKGMIIKFLHGLTPYFKSIQYDKKYARAVGLLEKDASRTQRKQTSVSGKSVEQSALIERVENNLLASDNEKLSDSMADDGELKDDFFDFLDDVPRKSKPAPIFMKMFGSKKSPYFKTRSPSALKPVTTSKNSTKPDAGNTESDSLNVPHADQGFKRPPSMDIVSNNPKKARLDESAMKPDTTRSESEILIDSESVPESNSDKTGIPAKEKVNAFVFLMNRSKEIAKASKLKKQTKADSTPLKKSPIMHAVK